ncbi:MAG: phytanoyl-CoA dioxygenase [Rhodospirillales bacterium CG15_BIG_FIL_POST_REV_8_21_14_020_66_15]|nr:MAG: phytanoyl-CoA dioxygenase [Rhodospirillales bacterium CG15_BIG_FIL_POST_REV_8_21_14_020_66_15]
MLKALTTEALRQFREEGYYSPVDVLPPEEARGLRDRIEAFEADQGAPVNGLQRNKSHLLFKWLDDLIRDDRIVDMMEDILGPDILCWNTLFWTKEPGSGQYVSWHQDSNYWGLAGGEVVTAWLALSEASEEAGCMRVMPGTHLGPPLKHEDLYHADNMLTRGQEITQGIDEAKAVLMPLRPGQMSLHNIRLAHASGPNMSADRRVGISLHYMPAKAMQSVGQWDSAALVRGEDRFGHFEHTPRVTADMDPDAVAFHVRAAEAVRQVLYHGAEQMTGKL